MQRRRFLTLGAAGAAGWGLALQGHAERRVGPVLYCPVAGVTYRNVDFALLHTGCSVNLARDKFAGEICYRVITPEGADLGFVPRTWVPVLHRYVPVRCWLSNINPYALPWKRIELAVQLQATAQVGQARG